MVFKGVLSAMVTPFSSNTTGVDEARLGARLVLFPI